jgi:hypothetical protein
MLYMAFIAVFRKGYDKSYPLNFTDFYVFGVFFYFRTAMPSADFFAYHRLTIWSRKIAGILKVLGYLLWQVFHMPGGYSGQFPKLS